MPQPTDTNFSEMATIWQRRKQDVKDAQARLLEIESDIFNAVRDALPEKGTSTFGDIKIVTGYTESYDQDGINAAYQQWPNEVPFPFTGEWKPDGKQLSYLREHRPELYALLSPSLTLKPKKPSFSVKE